MQKKKKGSATVVIDATKNEQTTIGYCMFGREF